MNTFFLRGCVVELLVIVFDVFVVVTVYVHSLSVLFLGYEIKEMHCACYLYLFVILYSIVFIDYIKDMKNTSRYWITKENTELIKS